jgi:hypothetical protein
MSKIIGIKVVDAGFSGLLEGSCIDDFIAGWIGGTIMSCHVKLFPLYLKIDFASH